MSQISNGTTQLSALDLIMPPVHTRMILALSINSTDSKIGVSALRDALDATAREIPLLTGTVEAAQPGGPLMVHFAKEAKVECMIKDWTRRDVIWPMSYAEHRDLEFEPSDLDGSKLLSLPKSPEAKNPVFSTQFNIIPGGALLAIACHHSVTDGPGVGTILRTWAGHCKAIQEGTASSFPSVNTSDLDRSPLIHGGKSENNVELPGYTITKTLPPQPNFGAMASMPAAVSKIFSITTAALASLKQDLISHLNPSISKSALSENPDDVKTWVSTNDTLCALIWHSVSKARLATSHSDLTTTSDDPKGEQRKLGFAVNGRTRLSPPLPSNYLGNVNIYACASRPLAALTSVVTSDLAATALSIRSAVNKVDDTYIRALLARCDEVEDVAKCVKPAFDNFFGKDFAITTWLEQGIYELDWGKALGGKVDAVRLPKAAFDGLAIVLPRRGDGGVEVLVGLKVEDMRRLEGDEVWRRFARLVGEGRR